MQKLWNLLPPDATVVPGHGRPTTRDGMKFTIDYLTALDRQVKQSLSEGLSLEETVSAATMEDFSGYALWDWVHSQINVPKTFNELSGDKK